MLLARAVLVRFNKGDNASMSKQVLEDKISDVMDRIEAADKSNLAEMEELHFELDNLHYELEQLDC